MHMDGARCSSPRRQDYVGSEPVQPHRDLTAFEQIDFPFEGVSEEEI